MKPLLRSREPAAAPDARAALADRLRHPRFEVLPLAGIVDRVLASVPRDVTLTVTASPKKGLGPTLDVTDRLVAEGYEVVPHVSARLVRDEAHLTEILDRLRAAGVRQIFAIAGDAPEPQGDYGETAVLLTAMGERRGQFEEIGISGYPESHHLISDESTIQAMFAKAEMATHIVSQIAFDPQVITGWIDKVRARGTVLPIWVGVPGSVDQKKLLRISMKIGLGESARFLASHKEWIRRLALRRRYTPDPILEGLAAHVARPDARVAGFHVYTFNEVEETERWRREALARLGG